MEISCKIDMAGFTKAINALPDEMMRQTRLALKESAQLLIEEARNEYDSASRKHTKDGRRIEQSIKQKQSDDGQSVTVYLDEKYCPYVKYVHDGTKDHFVSPDKAKALHWVSGGQSFFSKGHMVSGIEKDPFLYNAAKANTERIFDMIKSRISTAIKQAGF